MEKFPKPASIRQRWRRLRQSPRFPYLVFLGLLGLGGAWHGGLYWWDFRIQQMLKRNGGIAFRGNVLPASLKLMLGRRLSDPLEPINAVQLQPDRPMSGHDVSLLACSWSMEYFHVLGPISTEGLRWIGHFRGLKQLHLEYAGPGPTDADFESISHLPLLESIHCVGATAEPSGLRHLVRLKHLKTLVFTNIQALPRDQSTQSDQPAAFTADSLQHLALAKNLSELRIEKCPGFRDEHLLALTTALSDGSEPLPNLKILELSGTGITGRGLKYLGNLQNLTTLNLSGTAVDDEGLQSLKSVRTLKSLVLSRTPISDGGLATLVEMQNLEMLWVAGTKISEDGLVKLIAIRGLRRLVVGDVSEETLLKLRTHLACYVENP